MLAESIADRARKSISTFCFEECKSYCCRKGYLPLNESEIKLVLGDELDNLKKHSNGDLSLEFGAHGCPRLNDFKCTIHNDPKRPKVCRDYPIFVNGNTVRISSKCLAVRQNLLYPFIKEFMHRGFRVSDSVVFEDSGVD